MIDDLFQKFGTGCAAYEVALVRDELCELVSLQRKISEKGCKRERDLVNEDAREMQHLGWDFFRVGLERDHDVLKEKCPLIELSAECGERDTTASGLPLFKPKKSHETRKRNKKHGIC